MRLFFQRPPAPRIHRRLPTAAALAALAAGVALAVAPRPAAAGHVHSGGLLHPHGAATCILVREAGHRFHGHHPHRWHHHGFPGRRHHLGHHPHPGAGHRAHPGASHPAPHVVVAPGFFCNRCRVHFDHRRAFRRHAWHHHGIGRRQLHRISAHVDGLTILF